MKSPNILRLLPLLLASFFLNTQNTWAQKTELRGFVYDRETGEALPYITVRLMEVSAGDLTDVNGLYVISKIPAGTYTILCTGLGYDTSLVKLVLEGGKISSQNFYLGQRKIITKNVTVNSKRERKRYDPEPKIKIELKDIKLVPAIGGEPDLVQYLQVLPGVISSGDQGGQLYIRGGTPVMNKVLLDGMTIYNPFHSIGLFSVFDPDIIKSVDMYGASFGAQYGGRISAVLDVNTRDGRKNRLGGKVAATPFTGKVLLEGPLQKIKANDASGSSFLVSYRTSYLEKSSQIFYKYADPSRLPYNFNDLYGKLSFVGSNGSRASFFGFNFRDRVNFPNSTQYKWDALGGAMNFLVLPEGSATIINGVISYSDYKSQQVELDEAPRNSSINGLNANMNFAYSIGRSEFKYGFEINAFKTRFNYTNPYGRLVSQDENTTELCGFVRYKWVWKNWVLEPGVRFQYYASLGNMSVEPRLLGKVNLREDLRVRFGGGRYSQNLLSAVSDRDVINLFYGFLSGPDNLPRSFNGNPVTSKLQLANHALVGVEYDLGKYFEILVEAYNKQFEQLTNVNREKLFDDIPATQNKPEYLRKDFIIESGYARGVDVQLKAEYRKFYFWAVYSLTYVRRTYEADQLREYFPHFDRRHNVNIVASYAWGDNWKKQFNARWNIGSGFPFTLTQGFYEKQDFLQGVSADYLTSNGVLGIQYADLNTGRLPWYHRLDVSFEITHKLSKWMELGLNASVTNVYNRDNIFYFDRLRYQRVNQLPILPSVGVSLSF